MRNYAVILDFTNASAFTANKENFTKAFRDKIFTSFELLLDAIDNYLSLHNGEGHLLIETCSLDAFSSDYNDDNLPCESFISFTTVEG